MTQQAAAPLSRSRDVAAHIESLLKRVRIANGFETDIGMRVFRGRRKIDESIVPGSTLVEGSDKPSGASGLGKQTVTQEYTVGAYNDCDPDNPNDAAHQILADLKRAIFTMPTEANDAEKRAGAERFGGRVKSVEYKGRELGPVAEGAPLVYAVLHFDVTFVENLTAP